MSEKEFMEKNIKNICLEDNRISLEAKGLYYMALNYAYNNEKSVIDLFRSLNEDKEFILQLVEELIKFGYFIIGVHINEDDIFIFKIQTRLR